ncbi:MAG: class I SAM-dependent methyltransferase [Bacteroidota bacterium]
MSSTISQYLSHQDAPGILHRFPRLLYPYFFLNYLSVLRMKYARRAINRALVSIPSPQRIVEAGCGMGDFLFTVPKLRFAPQSLGIDVSPSNISVCQRLAQTIDAKEMTFICSDLTAADIPAGQDLILCIGVLMYIKDDEVVLRKFHDALSAHGKLLIYVAVNYRRTLSLYKRLAKNPGFDYDEIIGRPQTYTDESLEQLLNTCGFRIEQKEHSFGTFAATMFEISAIFEWVVKTQNPLISLLILPLYCLFYPVYFVSMLLDYFTARPTGNGVMITAVKS